ncbi:MAG: hypothetical protein JXJ19_07275 [Elusimicrobia bacterium]|nr:hypothetical protein [Elusimicrobiota bacterium]
MKCGAREGQVTKGTALSVLKFDDLKKGDEYAWLENLIPDIIVSNLASSGEYNVILREKLDSVLREREMGCMGIIDENTAAELCGIAGVKILVMGSYVVNEPVINMNMKIIDVSTAKILDSCNVTGDINGFFEFEKNMLAGIFHMLSINKPVSDGNFFFKVNNADDKACFAPAGGAPETSFRDYFDRTFNNYFTEYLNKLKMTGNEDDRKQIMMDIVDIIIEQIKQSGVETHVGGDVDIEVRNNYAPVTVKVPLKCWISNNMKGLLTNYSRELGGYCARENERGMYFKLTSDDEINEYFRRMISSCRYRISIIFTDSCREIIMDKEAEIELSEFFMEKDDSMFINDLPMNKIKKCSVPGNRADDIDLIQLKNPDSLMARQ